MYITTQCVSSIKEVHAWSTLASLPLLLDRHLFYGCCQREGDEGHWKRYCIYFNKISVLSALLELLSVLFFPLLVHESAKFSIGGQTHYALRQTFTIAINYLKGIPFFIEFDYVDDCNYLVIYFSRKRLS